MRSVRKLIAVLTLMALATPTLAFEWKLAENDGRDPIGSCLASGDMRGCIAEAWAAYVAQREPILDERDWRTRPKSQELIERKFYRIDVYRLTIEDIPVDRRSPEDWTWPAVSTLNRFDVPSWRYGRVTLRPGDIAIDVYFEFCHPSYQCLNLIDHAVRTRDFLHMPLERLRKGCSPRLRGEACYEPWQRQSIPSTLLKDIHDACYRTGCGILTFSRGRGFPTDQMSGTFMLRQTRGRPGWELIDVDAPQIGGSMPDYPSVLSVLRFPGRWPKFEVPWEYSLGEVLLRGDHRFVYSAIADCGPHSHGEAVAGYGHEGFGGYFGLVGRHEGPATCDSGIEYRIELAAGRFHYEDDDFRGRARLEIQVGEDVRCKEWVTLEFSLIRNPVRWRAAFTNPCNGKREWVDLYIQSKHEFLFKD